MARPEDSGQRWDEREVVALFSSERELQAAVDALVQLGLQREDMSALTAPPKGDGPVTAAAEAEDPETPRESYKSAEDAAAEKSAIVAAPVYALGVGTAAVVATSGAALIPIIAITAGGAAAGGVIGLLLARLVGHRHAEHIGKQLASGGLVLWVRNPDPARDAQIMETLRAHGAVNVHVHVVHRTWDEKDAPLSSFNPDPLLERG